MKKYFSNSKDYYLMSMQDILDTFKKDFDEENLVKIKKKIEFEIPENEGIFCIDTNDIYKVRDTIKGFINQALGIEDTRVDRAAKFEEPKPLTPEQMEEKQEEVIKLSMDYLSKIDKTENLSYEDETGIDIKFEFKNEQKEEKIKFGDIVMTENVEFDKLSNSDKKMLKEIKKNTFFKNMSKELNKVEFVKCDAVDSENYCIKIPLRDTNLILSKKEVQEYLDKYKENETCIRPKINDDLVLA